MSILLKLGISVKSTWAQLLLRQLWVGVLVFFLFFSGLRTRGWNKCLGFLSSFLFTVKNLDCFGKQSSDLTSALRIGWQEVAQSSSWVWQHAKLLVLKHACSARANTLN